MKPNRSTRRTVLGIFLIAFGIIWAVSQIFPNSINLMFEGWWTLFIIVPSLIGLITERDKYGPLFGLFVGVLMLCIKQGLLSWSAFAPILLAGLAIVIGLKLIFGFTHCCNSDKQNKIEASHIIRDGRNIRSYEVTFSGQKVCIDNEPFDGADLECNFGAIELDLSRAVIAQDVVVRVECNFGGVTIVVPTSCGVKVASKNAFGGVADKRHHIPENPAHIIYVDGSVNFAGVEIKD